MLRLNRTDFIPSQGSFSVEHLVSFIYFFFNSGCTRLVERILVHYVSISYSNPVLELEIASVGVLSGLGANHAGKEIP